MPDFIDPTGRAQRLDRFPRRIISVVPSQTELLSDLGLDEEVAGITKFCVHPVEWFTHKTKVGGTKELRIDLIHELQPDLIIANKEENIKEQVEELARHYPVWMSDISNLVDAYEMILQIGVLTDKINKSGEIISGIKARFSQLLTPDSRLRTAYLVWRKPYMTIGEDTFIHSMLDAAGFENIFKQWTRYPEISIDDLRIARCQLLLLPSEPFPFQQKHINELKELLPGIKIILVDGEMFSWYGSRMLQAPGYFRRLREQIRVSR